VAGSPRPAVLLTIDLVLAANLDQAPPGAWLPRLASWWLFNRPYHLAEGRARSAVSACRRGIACAPFIASLHGKKPPLPRGLPGVALFLNRGKDTAQTGLRANVKKTTCACQVRYPDRTTLHVRTCRARTTGGIDDLGYQEDRIYIVTARFGDTWTPPRVLRNC